MTKLAIIYYSATGHCTAMAQRIARAAKAADADVRVRHIAETRDPASFAKNQQLWSRTAAKTTTWNAISALLGLRRSR